MAKQDADRGGYPPVQRPTEEVPPVTIETVQEGVPAEQAPLDPQTMPSGMVGTVADSARAAASAAVEATEDSYIYNPNTRETRVVRAGAPATSMPFGFRVATADEIAAYKATQPKG